VTQRNKYLLGVIILFAFSRLVFYKIGIRFDSSTLEDFIQFLDTVLLRNRLWESIFFLHCQPPLFNLFLGVILKFFPVHWHILFHIIYLICGLMLAVTLFLLMTAMEVDLNIAFFATVLFMISPSVILYENWLFISYPEALLLCVAALALNLYLRRFAFLYGIIFFVSLMLLALTRSIYHLFWFLLIVFFIIAFNRQQWKKVLLACIIPFTFIFAVYAKNFYLFGNFSTGFVFMSYQLGTMTIHPLSQAELEYLLNNKLISYGTVQELMHVSYMGKTSFENIRIVPTGIPVLDNFTKTNGQPNFNSRYHLFSAKQHYKDALCALKHFPVRYFKALKWAYILYCFPGPTDTPFKNREYIKDYENIYNFLFYYQNKINSGTLYFPTLWYGLQFVKWDFLSRIFFFLSAMFYAILAIFGLKLLYRQWRLNIHGDLSIPFFLSLFFVCINIVYVTFASGAFAYGGNNRYRFAIDPFYLILFALLLTRLYNFFNFKKIKKC